MSIYSAIVSWSLNLTGGTGLIELMGGTMRIWICLGLLIDSTVSAYAGGQTVPEIDAASGLAAMGVVCAITALIWERRRRK
jgi:hypothetical protein